MARATLAFALVACVAAGASALVTADTTAATAKARAWLSAHQQPGQDELAELKSADPNSYAVVKALLAKQSLGLLNPRHPSEGFASTEPHLSAEGAASLARMEAAVAPKPAPVALRAPPKVEPVYASAGVSHHDWSKFKAVDSDDDILASVGAAPAVDSDSAEGSLLSETRAAQSILPTQNIVPDDPAPLAPSKNVAGMEIPVISWGDAPKKTEPVAPAPVAVAAAAPVASKSPMSLGSTSDYLAPGGIDFGSLIPATEKAAPVPKKAAMNQADSELSDIDFKSDLPMHPKGWKAPVVQKAAPTEPPVQNALTDFDFSTPDAAPAPVAKAASAAQTNTYLDKVNLSPLADKLRDQDAGHKNPYMQMMGMATQPQADASLLAGRAAVSAPYSPPQPSNGYLRAIHFGNVRKSKSIYGDFENDLDN